VLVRHIAPLFVFSVQTTVALTERQQRERNSVHWMNLAILAMVVGLSAIFGIVPYFV